MQAHDLERVLPTGTMSIIINLADDTSRKYAPADPRRVERLPRSILSGPHGAYFLIDTAEQASILGVAFAPGGAAPFLHMPASEVRDLLVSVEDVWGAEAHGLRERLLGAAPDDRFAILESWLLQQACGDLTQHPAVTHALTEFGGVPHTRSVSEVTDHVGLSSRRFIEVFDDEVGLTPKLYSRINRLRSVVERVARGGDVAWADLASEYGYYDQSHLTRDFREFSGVTPGDYKPLGPAIALHMELDGASGR